MDETENIKPEKPSHRKLMEFDEIVEYAKKNNKPVNNAFLAKYGFMPTEIKWLKMMRSGEFDMNGGMYMKNAKSKDSYEKYYNDLLDEYNKLLKQYNELAAKTNEVSDVGVKVLSVDDNHWLYNKFYYKNGKKHNENVYVDKKNVVDMWKIIELLTDEDNDTTDYRQIVNTLIIKKGFGLDSDAFNGGKNRVKYYFPYYYYPIKVLQEFGYIEYKNRRVVRKAFDKTADDLKV